jgi:DcuC family C4-dicarboxylate transporter
VAAQVSGLEPVVYFARYQLPVALFVIPVVAVLHFFWQGFCDRKAGASEDDTLDDSILDDQKGDAPGYYAILPVLPLVFLLVFSPLMVKGIRVDVVTAMLISLFISMACEAIRHRSLRNALAGIVHFFQGMGDIFAKVVTLIVAAECFSTGVKATGLIEQLIGSVQNGGYGSITMVIILALLIGLTALLTGSGNAALFSFANMIPGIAEPMGTSTVFMMLPSQLSAGMFRSMSPVAGVIIAVSTTANVSPFTLVKRTSVPMIGGILVMLIASNLLN